MLAKAGELELTLSEPEDFQALNGKGVTGG